LAAHCSLQAAAEMLGDANPLLIRFVLRVAECLLNLCRCDEAAHTLQAIEGLAASTKPLQTLYCRTDR
jgi:hypothetical protein